MTTVRRPRVGNAPALSAALILQMIELSRPGLLQPWRVQKSAGLESPLLAIKRAIQVSVGSSPTYALPV